MQGPAAHLQVVVQAGPFILARDLSIAVEIGKDAPDALQGPIDGTGVRVGAEVARPVPAHRARDLDFGERVLPVDLQVGEGLVVLEQDVEGWLVLLDEIVFERERLQFIGGDPPGHVRDFRHQALHPGIVPLAGREVAAHARPQDFGLADVQDLARGAVHQIATGGTRQFVQLPLHQRGYRIGHGTDVSSSPNP